MDFMVMTRMDDTLVDHGTVTDYLMVGSLTKEIVMDRVFQVPCGARKGWNAVRMVGRLP